jgi:hypothetical protein
MRINKPLNQKQKFYTKKSNIKKVFKNVFVNHLSIVLFANLITFINYALDWPLVRLAGVRLYSFVDTIDVLRIIQCVDREVFNDEVNKECKYYYGSILVLISNGLKFNIQSGELISWFLLISCTSIIGFLVALGTQKIVYKLLYITVLLISPAISLLFERANLDILMFAIVVFSAFFYSNQRKKISIVLLLITVLIKFYTLPLLILVVIINLTKRNFVYAFIMLAGLLGVLTIELSKIPGIFKLNGWMKFGIGVLFDYYPEQFGMLVPESISTTIGFVLLFFTSYIIRKKMKPKVLENFNLKSSYFTGSNFLNITSLWCLSIFLTSYFAGYNYDFRLIYLAIGTLLVFNLNLSNKFKFYSYSITLIALWGSIGIPGDNNFDESKTTLTEILAGAIGLTGDLAIFFIAAYILASGTLLINQLLQNSNSSSGLSG